VKKQLNNLSRHSYGALGMTWAFTDSTLIPSMAFTRSVNSAWVRLPLALRRRLPWGSMTTRFAEEGLNLKVVRMVSLKSNHTGTSGEAFWNWFRMKTFTRFGTFPMLAMAMVWTSGARVPGGWLTISRTGAKRACPGFLPLACGWKDSWMVWPSNLFASAPSLSPKSNMTLYNYRACMVFETGLPSLFLEQERACRLIPQRSTMLQTKAQKRWSAWVLIAWANSIRGGMLVCWLEFQDWETNEDCTKKKCDKCTISCIKQAHTLPNDTFESFDHPSGRKKEREILDPKRKHEGGQPKPTENRETENQKYCHASCAIFGSTYCSYQ